MTRKEAIEELKEDIELYMPSDPILLDRELPDGRLITALEMAIKALEQEPCEDAVSRQAVCNIVDAIRDCISVEGYWAILERLKKLPSVNPQEPFINKPCVSSGVCEHEKNQVLDKIRSEIKKAIWEDVIVSLDGTDEVRIPCLDPDDVFEIIDKYKAESEGKE